MPRTQAVLGLPAVRTCRALLALAIAPLVASCGAGPPAERSLPLVDGLHAPDVLTESRRLEHPRSRAGNRFLHGWRIWRRKGTLWLVPEPRGARLEAVQLVARTRSLILNTEIFQQSADDRVLVEAAVRELPSVPLASPLEIELPGDLPVGRFPITLRFPPEAQVALDAAGFREALPPGEVEFEEAEILQSGNSAVEFVRRVEGGALLVGSFVPPAEARPGQRFAIQVEHKPGQPTTLFEWRSTRWSRLLGSRGLSLSLRDAPGLVRIRLLATGQGPAARWRELRLVTPETTAQEEPSDPPPAPQVVVLYVLDALRADYLTHLGGPSGATPFIDRLAREGVTFRRHQSVAPSTLPSTKSLFTGQAFVSRGNWKLPRDGPNTLAELFAAAGYRTAAFSGSGYIGPAWGTARGFEHLVFEDYCCSGRYNDNAERVHRSALAWLNRLSPDDRVFLYLHTMHPHNPYDPPAPLEARFASDIESQIDGGTDTLLHLKHGRLQASESDRQRLRALYAAALSYNDAQLKTLVEELQGRYPPGEVLLIVTSDHGEELFDHGGVLHGYTLYREQLHIPLILWWPGHLDSGRVDTPTVNLDLHESLRALVGAPVSGAGDGRPLWSLARDTVASLPRLVRYAAASSVKGGVFSAQSERYKLVFAPRTGFDWGMGEGRGRSRDPEYLFDLQADPEETENLAGMISLEAAWLRSRLEAWIEHGRLQEAGAEEPVLDDEARKRLRALGYLE